MTYFQYLSWYVFSLIFSWYKMYVKPFNSLKDSFFYHCKETEGLKLPSVWMSNSDVRNENPEHCNLCFRAFGVQKNTSVRLRVTLKLDTTIAAHFWQTRQIQTGYIPQIMQLIDIEILLVLLWSQYLFLFKSQKFRVWKLVVEFKLSWRSININLDFCLL